MTQSSNYTERLRPRRAISPARNNANTAPTCRTSHPRNNNTPLQQVETTTFTVEHQPMIIAFGSDGDFIMGTRTPTYSWSNNFQTVFITTTFVSLVSMGVSVGVNYVMNNYSMC